MCGEGEESSLQCAVATVARSQPSSHWWTPLVDITTISVSLSLRDATSDVSSTLCSRQC